MDSAIYLLNNWSRYYSRLSLSWTFWRNKKVQAIGSSKWITANKKIGKWDMERMQVSCTPHFKGSNRYFDVSKKELSNKAWVIYRDGHFIWMELTKNTRVLTIYMGNPGNFGWKIKRFRGPFLESPVNFSGPKTNIQIKIKRIRARFPARKLLHFVSLTDSFIMLDTKLLKPRSLMEMETAYRAR